MDKKVSRLRRAVPTRRKINELRVHRLSIFRSNQHIYANIISPEGDRVLVSASTVEAEVRAQLAGQTGQGGNKAAASLVASAWPKRPRLPVSNWSLSIARAFVTMPRESAGRCRA